MYDFGTDPAPKVVDVEYGGIGVNNGTLTTKMMNQHSVLNYPAEWNLSDGTSFNNKALGLTGMLGSYSSSILNGETGIIDMYGRGSVGMLVIDKSTADNEGQITRIRCGSMKMMRHRCVIISPIAQRKISVWEWPRVPMLIMGH